MGRRPGTSRGRKRDPISHRSGECSQQLQRDRADRRTAAAIGQPTGAHRSSLESNGPFPRATCCTRKEQVCLLCRLTQLDCSHGRAGPADRRDLPEPVHRCWRPGACICPRGDNGWRRNHVGMGRSQWTCDTFLQPRALLITPRLSPDGLRVAVGVYIEGQGAEIWVYDADRPTRTRLTFDGGGDPVWTPDGRRITYSSGGLTSGQLYWVTADGSGKPERLVTSPTLQSPHSWSPDGKVSRSTSGRNKERCEIFGCCR